MKKAMQRIDKLIPWTIFRSLSNAQIMKSTILIPVLGYWILFNEKLLPYFELSKGFYDSFYSSFYETGQTPTIPLHLLQVYFGLCLLAVGSFLYQCCCPREIKRYGSAPEYIAGDRDSISAYQMTRIENYFENAKSPENLRKDYQAIMDYNEETVAGGADFYERLEKSKLKRKVDILGLWFTAKDHDYPRVRLALSILYAVGFISLSIPSLTVFFKVCFLLVQP